MCQKVGDLGFNLGPLDHVQPIGLAKVDCFHALETAPVLETQSQEHILGTESRWCADDAVMRVEGREGGTNALLDNLRVLITNR